MNKEYLKKLRSAAFKLAVFKHKIEKLMECDSAYSDIENADEADEKTRKLIQELNLSFKKIDEASEILYRVE